jgi:hypothetical protein
MSRSGRGLLTLCLDEPSQLSSVSLEASDEPRLRDELRRGRVYSGSIEAKALEIL